MVGKASDQDATAKFDPQLNAGRLGADSAEWDRPGHDGVTGEHDTDPDRRDLRAEIGKYVSVANFPATGREVVAAVEGNGAPAEMTNMLAGLDGQAELVALVICGWLWGCKPRNGSEHLSAS